MMSTIIRILGVSNLRLGEDWGWIRAKRERERGGEGVKTKMTVHGQKGRGNGGKMYLTSTGAWVEEDVAIKFQGVPMQVKEKKGGGKKGGLRTVNKRKILKRPGTNLISNKGKQLAAGREKVAKGERRTHEKGSIFRQKKKKNKRKKGR